MTFSISDKCLACDTCLGACPLDVVAKGYIYKIHPQRYKTCGTRVDQCPTGAIM